MPMPGTTPAAGDSAARLPRHIAIIMDGNGRWAARRHLPRQAGHREGQKAGRAAVEFCLRRHIDALTLFAFSSENWQRPAREVRTLMHLFVKAIDSETAELDRNGVRIRFIGDPTAFAPDLRTRMADAMARTAANGALHFNVAVNYGGRWDIAQAARKVAAAAVRGDLAVDSISEATLAPYLTLADEAPVDLLIRTGGELRVSNFLLWQVAYAELWFTDTLWPDVDADVLDAACTEYARRERRYGRTSAQLRAAG